MGYKVTDGGRLSVDGTFRLSRLNETDFDLVSGGFLVWSLKVIYPRSFSLFVLERRVLWDNMVPYYFYDG